MTLLDAATLDQSGPGSDGNEGVLNIPPNSSITKASSSDCLVSYPGHPLGKSYHTVEIKSMYSAAPADWAIRSIHYSKPQLEISATETCEV